jgi:integrase
MQHAACANRHTVADLFLAGLLISFHLGELLALKWSNVDFQAGVICTRGLKTGRGIEADTGRTFKEMLLRRQASTESEWVFTDTTADKPIKSGAVYAALCRAARKAGVSYEQKDGFTFHDARRTAISEMIEAASLCLSFNHPQDRTVIACCSMRRS